MLSVVVFHGETGVYFKLVIHNNFLVMLYLLLLHRGESTIAVDLVDNFRRSSYNFGLNDATLIFENFAIFSLCLNTIFIVVYFSMLVQNLVFSMLCLQVNSRLVDQVQLMSSRS